MAPATPRQRPYHASNGKPPPERLAYFLSPLLALRCALILSGAIPATYAYAAVTAAIIAAHDATFSAATDNISPADIIRQRRHRTQPPPLRQQAACAEPCLRLSIRYTASVFPFRQF